MLIKRQAKLAVNGIDFNTIGIFQCKKRMGIKDKNGKPFSKTYLKTIHNQISAILNHAVRYYDLKVNPAAKVGNMGKEQTKEMRFWTKAEYLKFSEAMMDKSACKTVGFTVSPEENDQINFAFKLSGHTKQDFLISRVLNIDIIVHGNPRVYKALKNQLAEVLSELKRIKNGLAVDDDLLPTIQLITTTLNGLKGDRE